MKIVGGMSGYRWVSIMSDRFVATATCAKDTQEITWRVTEQRSQLGIIHHRKWWFVPQVARKAMFIWIQMGWLHRALTLWGLGLIMIAMQIGGIDLSHPIESTIGIVLSGGLVWWFVASWHAAEHQAITAADKGQYDLAAIARAPRITTRCGSRWFVPLVLVTFGAPMLAHSVGWPIVLTWLALIELVFQIDYWWGWQRVPVFKQVMLGLQYLVLTRRAGILELKTAQAAIQALVDAHKELNLQPHAD